MKTIIGIFLILCVFSGTIRADNQAPGKKLKIADLEEKLKTASGDKEKISILDELADCFFEMSPEKNVKYARQAMELADIANDEIRKADALSRIGTGYRRMGNYDRALEYHLNGLKIRETLDDKKNIADSLHQVGIIYFYLNNYGKALTYYRDAMKIREQIGDRRGISDSLNNIAIIKYNELNYDKALEYHQKALAIREETGDMHGVAGSCNNIGLICKDTGRYGEALENYLRALKIVEQVGDQFEISSISNNIGELYILIKNSDQALSYLDRGWRVAHEIGAKELLRENYAFTSELFAAEKNYQKALYYFKKSSDIQARIFSEDTGKRIADMQKLYEIEKREREIELLEKESRIRQLDLTRQKLMKNSFFAGFCFVLLLTVTLYMLYLTKKKSHADLEAAHNIIRLHAKSLENELEIGRRIQQNFFPETIPRVSGWEIAFRFEAARQVSGDFYDVFPLGKQGSVFFVIADVCDKGVGAALFMGLFRSLIRAFADYYYGSFWDLPFMNIQDTDCDRGHGSQNRSDHVRGLETVISMTNNYIAGTHSTSNMFATIFLGVLESDSGEIFYVNAGHEPPVVLGKHGIKHILEPTGPAVGMIMDIKFEAKKLVFDPGDILVAFTDGVTEARSADGRFYGNETLFDLIKEQGLSADHMLSRIKSDVASHTEGAVPSDDITLLAVRKTLADDEKEI